MNKLHKILQFLLGSFRLAFRGGTSYYLWLWFLGLLLISGLFAYADQFRYGLIVTHMRDQVSWAFYIGNFTFLVGVAAAAVLLVVPGMTPDTLGEIYEYAPTMDELHIGAGFFAVGFIIFTLLCKAAIPLIQRNYAREEA